MVCSMCHSSLGGGLSVNATGEFKVPTEAIIEAQSAPPGERPHTTNVCAWCGKLEVDVRKLLGRAGIALCNECVALACDIMEAELGGDWR